MTNLLGWMKSTRSIAVVLIIILLYIVVIGAIFGTAIPNEVLTIVGTTVGAVVTAYFGKRDSNE